jgi:hypothetical protein
LNPFLAPERSRIAVIRTSALARLYAPARLFVNVFQPRFKLAEKKRDRAQVTKRYHKPQTPCDRLPADARVGITPCTAPTPSCRRPINLHVSGCGYAI